MQGLPDFKINQRQPLHLALQVHRHDVVHPPTVPLKKHRDEIAKISARFCRLDCNHLRDLQGQNEVKSNNEAGVCNYLNYISKYQKRTLSFSDLPAIAPGNSPPALLRSPKTKLPTGVGLR